MTISEEPGLLASGDAAPVKITNRDGGAMFLLLGDHAGNRVPQRLGGLGLDPRELGRHIALDLGVSVLGSALSCLLDAPFVEQRYSRLVIDCNRSLDDPGSIAALSDGTAIAANAAISAAERAARAEAIFHPYHEAIAGLMAERVRRGQATILVSLHSFTPVLGGAARPWQVGVLHGEGDARFALAVLEALRCGALTVGDNQPYRFDATDYTVPRHAIANGLAYVELEIRQDVLASEDEVGRMAQLLASVLTQAAAAC